MSIARETCKYAMRATFVNKSLMQLVGDEAELIHRSNKHTKLLLSCFSPQFVVACTVHRPSIINAEPMSRLTFMAYSKW